MARARIQINRAGMRQLLRSPGVRADLARRGAAVLGAAAASAPVATGAYRDSLRTYPATTDRAVQRVAADVAHATAVNADTGHLSRALDAAGGS